jgi:hypothetical protein
MRRTTRGDASHHRWCPLGVLQRSSRGSARSRCPLETPHRTDRRPAFQHGSSREGPLYHSPRSRSAGAREWSCGRAGVLELFAQSAAAVPSHRTRNSVYLARVRVRLRWRLLHTTFVVASLEVRRSRAAQIMWGAAAGALGSNHLTARVRLWPTMRRCSSIVRSRYLTDSSLYSWCGFAAILASNRGARPPITFVWLSLRPIRPSCRRSLGDSARGKTEGPLAIGTQWPDNRNARTTPPICHSASQGRNDGGKFVTIANSPRQAHARPGDVAVSQSRL